jgi:HEAT repeat protein
MGATSVAAIVARFDGPRSVTRLSDPSTNGGGLELENLGSAPGPGSTSPKMLVPLFLVPLLIVAVIVGVFLGVGALVNTEKKLEERLVEVENGGVNERWQAAAHLSDLANSHPEQFADPHVRDRLRRMFESAGPQDSRLRQWIAEMWGQIGDASAAPLMVEGVTNTRAALDQPGGRTGPAAELASKELITYLRAIGRVEAATAEPAVLAAASDSDAGVRLAVTEALGGIGRGAIKSGKAPSAELVAALTKLHDDADAWVRMSAALFLAKCRRTEGLTTLEAMLDREWLQRQGLHFPDDGRYSVNEFDPAPEKMIYALLAIGELVDSGALQRGGDAPLRDAVAKAANDRNGEVKRRATELQKKLGG